MVRRLTPSQYAAEIRRRQQAAQRAVDEYNRKVRAYNSALDREAQERKRAIEEYNRKAQAHNSEVERRERERKTAIEEYNRQARRHNEKVRQNLVATRRAVDQYNQQVRAHNSRVRAEHSSSRARADALRSRTVSEDFVAYRDSATSLFDTFDRIEATDAAGDGAYPTIREAVERENRRSLDTAAILAGDAAVQLDPPTSEEDQQFVDALREFSEDLALRWQGAVYALGPQNPDAARHFCTSVREIFSTIIDISAPDTVVLQSVPDCQKAPNGKTPARRAKIEFLIAQKSGAKSNLADFVEADIKNIIDLFGVFNSATHGAAGKYSMDMLQAIRVRVQEGVLFLLTVST